MKYSERYQYHIVFADNYTVLRRYQGINIVQRSVDLVRLRAAIVRESRHLPDECFKMFLIDAM